ncbi:MAG: aminotransferase class III-fold pyridoxal phosphate-dependent enzyme, partial [Candidatus Margulisiibacteriota bacterium]|nr:aminotransferase class III-fold pyridoxal phosphate-dependent enzyme [Candidatus Margulisiibacteriota bacterium]
IKLDFINGIGAHFGHSLELLRNANINAAIEDTIMQGNLQQNERSFKLMKLLLQQSKFDHCMLTSSGAMANENGLKLLFHKSMGKSRLLAFENCFMGRTLSLAQITDKAKYRKGLPSIIHVDYLPFYDSKNHKKSINETKNKLKQLLQRYPNQYAGICMELIQGEGGYNIGNEEFFKEVIALLKNESIPVLIDEVQTFGRTSELFASQHFNIIQDVDIITIGKLSQVCATIFKKEMKPEPGLISQTFTASTSAIESGHQIISHLIKTQYFGKKGKNMVFGNYFNSLIKKLSIKHPNKISGPYGLGGMLVFTPFEGNPNLVSDLLLKLYNNGLMGFTTGSYPQRIRFLLPLGSVTKKDIEEAINIIDKSISETP